jgi:hypothetical protein
LESVVAAEEYVPLLSVTEPVGVPFVPVTVTVTCNDCCNDCAVVMLPEAGVTVTVGVPFDGGGCVFEPPPPTHPATQSPVRMLNQIAACRPKSFIAQPLPFTGIRFSLRIPGDMAHCMTAGRARQTGPSQRHSKCVSAPDREQSCLSPIREAQITVS